MSVPEQHRPVAAARVQRGLSIIELMVGIVISLLVGLTAMSSANHFAASQRTAVGTGTASVAMTSALASIKEDTAQAGLGFFGNSQYSCAALNLSAKARKLSDGTVFSPLQITRDAGSDNDQLDVLYGSQIEAGIGVLLRDDMASDSAGANVNSYLPSTAGQAVLIMPGTPGAACTVRSVTQVTPATDVTPLRLEFGPGGLHNDVAFTTHVAYDTKGKVAPLGTLQWRRYRVSGGHLILEMPLDETSATLVRNVVAFRVQYGIADSATGTTLADWVDPTGAWASLTAGNIPQVRAVRIGIVSRSPQKEKADKDGNCVATADADKPKLFGDTVSPSGADWGCWRYRTSSVVVPLRNIVLGRSG